MTTGRINQITTGVDFLLSRVAHRFSSPAAAPHAEGLEAWRGSEIPPVVWGCLAGPSSPPNPALPTHAKRGWGWRDAGWARRRFTKRRDGQTTQRVDF